MVKPDRYWGNITLAFSFVIIPLSVYILYTYPVSGYGSFHNLFIPWTATGFSFLVILLTRLSYPRVKNGRVVFLSMTSGIVCFLLFCPHLFPKAVFLPGMSSVLILGAGGVLFSALTPALANRTVFRWQYAAYGLFLSALTVILLFYGKRFFWQTFVPLPVWIRVFSVAFVWAGLCVLVRMRLRQDFGLDGILCGTGSVYLFGFYASFTPSAVSLIHLCVFFLSVYLCAGILLHWFLRLDHRAHYDPLLKIYNRGYADSVIQENMARIPYSVILFDIDHFKSINDTHGHQAGDLVLFGIAQTLQRLIVPDGVLCRYGGEEIVVFLSGKSVVQAVDLAERCRRAVEDQAFAFNTKKIRVTLSAGAAGRENADVSLSELVAHADICLYKAKENGRNRVIGSKGTVNAKGVRKQVIKRTKKRTGPVSAAKHKKTKSPGRKMIPQKESLIGREWKAGS